MEADEIDHIEKLLIPVIQNGEIVAERPTIPEMWAMRDADIEALDPGVRRIMNPHTYHVSLSQKLWDLKQAMIQKTKAA